MIMDRRPSSTIKKRLLTYLSCSQASLSTVAEGLGLSAPGLLRAAHHLEGGGLNCGSTCGIVSGGCLAIALACDEGLAWHDRRQTDVRERCREYTQWFERGFGSTLCRERVGTGLTTAGGIAAYLLTGKAFTRCMRHAGPAAEFLSSRFDPPVEPARPSGVWGTAGGCCAGPVLREIRRKTGYGDERLEALSTALDGGVGLSGGLCGALAGALAATGLVWGVDPGETGVQGSLGWLLAFEYDVARRAPRPGSHKVVRLVEGFRDEFGSLECSDIARPFTGGEELAGFVAGSSACARAIDWCAETATELLEGAHRQA